MNKPALATAAPMLDTSSQRWERLAVFLRLCHVHGPLTPSLMAPTIAANPIRFATIQEALWVPTRSKPPLNLLLKEQVDNEQGEERGEGKRLV